MIAVAGGKGGSGKTTTTVGLARALSRRGAPVVAADADWDLPNLARLAAETGERVDPELTPTIRDAIGTGGPIRPDRSAPTFLAAPERPREADARSALKSLGDAVPDDAPVVLDCPAGASPDAVAPLRVAERCLLVTPLRRAALRDAAKTAAVARRLDCRPVGVVVVHTRSAPDPVADLLGCPVLGRVPSREPEPLSTPAVASAYDGVAGSLVERAATDGWRIA